VPYAIFNFIVLVSITYILSYPQKIATP